jgi:hypothetical protein
VLRADGRELILGDTPVSVHDPTPPYPGSAAGVLSSPNAQLFLPLDPTFGVQGRPDPSKLTSLYDAAQALHDLSEEEQAQMMGPLEGSWAEDRATPDFVDELNLRTYTHAQRYIYGSQQAVCDAHRYARANPARRIQLAPAPTRVHILEDDPDQPGMMKAWKVFEPKPQKRRRR